MNRVIEKTLSYFGVDIVVTTEYTEDGAYVEASALGRIFDGRNAVENAKDYVESVVND